METITREHRFVPGAMFGGWGPHLGHLVRAPSSGSSGSDLYWVDDLCRQDVPGDCSVDVDRRVGILRRDAGSWTSVGTIALSGVQQNTGTVATGRILRVYGVDVSQGHLVECTYDLATGASLCAALPFALGASANYVGAALSPDGYRLAWWTNVSDTGGGTFSYVVNYDAGGWNGPRRGFVGGYNDCGYVNVAFRTDDPSFTFFGQVVLGMGPAWTFSTLVGAADLTTTDAVAWTNALAPPAGDPVASTNDVWTDDTTEDTHLLGRTASGAVAYYFRPRGGAWTGALFLEPASYRARWIATAEQLALVSGPSSGGLRVRLVRRDAIRAGEPLDLGGTRPVDIDLPAGFGPIVGIYTASRVYQSHDVTDLELALVGDTDQNEALYVHLTP